MPMHPKARDRMLRRLATCLPEHQDYYLDEYLDSAQRATEWDAAQWGLPYANESVPDFPDDGKDRYRNTEPKMRSKS